LHLGSSKRNEKRKDNIMKYEGEKILGGGEIKKNVEVQNERNIKIRMTILTKKLEEKTE